MRIIYDWVSICFQNHSIGEILALLGLEMLNFQEIKGAHGYRDRLYYDCISIHYNGRDDMGIWLEMSGKGCRIFEKFGNGDYDRLLNMAVDPQNGMHLTRLDIALDDLDGLLDIDRLCYDTRFGNVVTRFHEGNWHVHYSGGGNSIELGSKKSDILVRIYDKDAEQGHEEGRHWVRVELQLRRERAQGFVAAAEDTPSLGQRFRGVLASYVRFVFPSEDSNKRRWPMTDYWEELLDSAEAISIYEKPSMEYTLEKLESYVVNQAGNAIDAYIQLRGVDGFVDAIRERKTASNPKYEALIQALRGEEIVEREPTPEEIYANGLYFVLHKDFSKPYQIRDYYGHRWLKCEECGEIRRVDEMASYGGDLPNYGVCRECSIAGK